MADVIRQRTEEIFKVVDANMPPENPKHTYIKRTWHWSPLDDYGDDEFHRPDEFQYEVLEGQEPLLAWYLHTSLPSRDMTFFDREGAINCVHTGFPLRWLFEDFEDEFVNGRALYVKKHEEWKAESKAKRVEAKAAAAQTKQQILEKLTPEERKILGIRE